MKVGVAGGCDAWAACVRGKLRPDWEGGGFGVTCEGVIFVVLARAFGVVAPVPLLRFGSAGQGFPNALWCFLPV